MKHHGVVRSGVNARLTHLGLNRHGPHSFMQAVFQPRGIAGPVGDPSVPPGFPWSLLSEARVAFRRMTHEETAWVRETLLATPAAAA